MNTFSWILIGLICTAFALYFVFTFAKKIELIQKISSSALIPLLSFLYIIQLFNYVPDSFHIIKLTIISLLFLTVSFILGCFFDSKGTQIVERVSFIISLLPLALLYNSVFLIHNVPSWVNIIALCGYVVLFFLFFIIFVKKASLKLYGYAVISLIIVSFINYCSLLTLCFSPAAYSIIRFLGTSALLGYLVFQILNNSVIDLKLKKLISLMILLASLILIALSNLMILY